MNDIVNFKNIISCFPNYLAESINNLESKHKQNLKEIRLYENKNVILCFGKENTFLNKNGQVSRYFEDDLLTLKKGDIEEIFKAFCQYSIHSYLEEIKKGFITIHGGHRVGVYGTVVTEDRKVITIKDISSLNIRISRQIIGCSNDLVFNLFNKYVYSTLIVGVPNSGKTTLLRDIVRNLSGDKRLKKISVIDERGEISNISLNESLYNLGYVCDIYNLCPKEIGIEMALRAGSPDVIVCDEIGSDDDVKSMTKTMLSGVKVITTAHANTLDELLAKDNILKMLKKNIFEKIIFLDSDNIGRIRKIYDVKTEVKL